MLWPWPSLRQVLPLQPRCWAPAIVDQLRHAAPCRQRNCPLLPPATLPLAPQARGYGRLHPTIRSGAAGGQEPIPLLCGSSHVMPRCRAPPAPQARPRSSAAATHPICLTFSRHQLSFRQRTYQGCLMRPTAVPAALAGPSRHSQMPTAERFKPSVLREPRF